MPTFVIDEDMPRSTAGVLAESGHEALDVRDCGLRGADDHDAEMSSNGIPNRDN